MGAHFEQLVPEPAYPMGNQRAEDAPSGHDPQAGEVSRRELRAHLLDEEAWQEEARAEFRHFLRRVLVHKSEARHDIAREDREQHGDGALYTKRYEKT